ncbi:MAG: hypothetical protein Q8L37_03300 [Candidatus Gottesmanbacteria bacterium]|nr:hypothetical protein [Candidatus Gottesmanbacteria bacterium]
MDESSPTPPPLPPSPAALSAEALAKVEALAKEGDPSISLPQIVPPPLPVPHPSKLKWLLGGLTILILGILMGYAATNVLNQSKKPPNDAATPSQKSSTNFSQLTSSPTSTIEFNQELKTYKNPRGLNFSYPNGWQILDRTLNPGENLKEKGRYDISADKDPVEIVDVVKNDWTLRVTIKDAYSPLGGFGPIQDLHEYKVFPILGRNALRTKIEDGYMPAISDHPEPYPFPILFQRHPGETDPVYWRTPDTEGNFVPLFSTNDPRDKINIDAVIYSKFLTKNNINNRKIEPSIIQEIDQILSTFQFLDAPSPTTTTRIQATPIESNGVDLKGIRYTLPTGWGATLNADNLHLAPKSGGGYLYIEVFNYPGTTGRRDYYCQLRKYCIPETEFTETTIGNISGYRATRLDNSGGGEEYFGAKGNKFYIIGTYSPPSPNDFDNNYKSVLSSLIF